MRLRAGDEALVEHPRQELRRDDASLRVRRNEDSVCHLDRLEPLFAADELAVQLVDAVIDFTLTLEGNRLDIEGRDVVRFEIRVDGVVHHGCEFDAARRRIQSARRAAIGHGLSHLVPVCSPMSDLILRSVTNVSERSVESV